mmetsp:Transcript_12674/g.31559  ORF Transcript_12674/g.31559 Transcript_12674/m.31559 type:complete len:281 (+) Transcript_12674:85-927(+)
MSSSFDIYSDNVDNDGNNNNKGAVHGNNSACKEVKEGSVNLPAESNGATTKPIKRAEPEIPEPKAIPEPEAAGKLIEVRVGLQACFGDGRNPDNARAAQLLRSYFDQLPNGMYEQMVSDLSALGDTLVKVVGDGPTPKTRDEEGLRKLKAAKLKRFITDVLVVVVGEKLSKYTVAKDKKALAAEGLKSSFQKLQGEHQKFERASKEFEVANTVYQKHEVARCTLLSSVSTAVNRDAESAAKDLELALEAADKEKKNAAAAEKFKEDMKNWMANQPIPPSP